MTEALGRARLIGIIILARFLKLPLTRYEAVIEKVESSPMFTQLWPGIISANLFPRTQVLELPPCIPPIGPPPASPPLGGKEGGRRPTPSGSCERMKRALALVTGIPHWGGDISSMKGG